MPYIKKDRRGPLNPNKDNVASARDSGELNFQFTVLAHRFVAEHGLKYEVLNAVTGALDNAKVEFQRRVVAPYEDTKIKENGDVKVLKL